MSKDDDDFAAEVMSEIDRELQDEATLKLYLVTNLGSSKPKRGTDGLVHTIERAIVAAYTDEEAQRYVESEFTRASVLDKLQVALRRLGIANPGEEPGVIMIGKQRH